MNELVKNSLSTPFPLPLHDFPPSQARSSHSGCYNCYAGPQLSEVLEVVLITDETFVAWDWADRLEIIDMPWTKPR